MANGREAIQDSFVILGTSRMAGAVVADFIINRSAPRAVKIPPAKASSRGLLIAHDYPEGTPSFKSLSGRAAACAIDP
jgi:hypothetical protein